MSDPKADVANPAASNAKAPRDANPPKDPKAAIHEEWERRTREWERLARSSAIKIPPGASFDPKDVRVEIGPPMTEAQFKAWRERHKNFAKNFSK